MIISKTFATLSIEKQDYTYTATCKEYCFFYLKQFILLIQLHRELITNYDSVHYLCIFCFHRRFRTAHVFATCARINIRNDIYFKLPTECNEEISIHLFHDLSWYDSFRSCMKQILVRVTFNCWHWNWNKKKLEVVNYEESNTFPLSCKEKCCGWPRRSISCNTCLKCCICFNEPTDNDFFQNW